LCIVFLLLDSHAKLAERFNSQLTTPISISLGFAAAVTLGFAQ
jgi:hypothetical protein